MYIKYNNIEFPASSRKKIEDFAFGLDTVILKPSKKWPFFDNIIWI